MPRVKKAKTKKPEEEKIKRKKAVKKVERKVKEPISVVGPPKKEKYYQAVGRRKTAVARVRLFTKGEKVFLVNQKPIDQYFPIPEFQKTAKAALEKMKCLDKFRILVTVKGGGLSAQAEAIRHGIARALVLFNPNFRRRLKSSGFLTRDSRVKERKKFGLKRARRAPQWQKR